MENLKLFEDFIGGKQDSIIVDETTKNEILNVNKFENWLNEHYGPQKIGRSDLLSSFVIEKYFASQGVEGTEEEINDFINKIENTWRFKK